MTDTTSRIPSLRALVRHSFSALRTTPSICTAAEKCSTVLRHPRSRIRATPGWRAPRLLVDLPTGTATVYLSHHRATAPLLRRLRVSTPETTGTNPGTAVPEHHTHQLVTLSALVPEGELTTELSEMTADIEKLFREIIGTEVPWLSVETCGTVRPDSGFLEWTWHALTPEVYRGEAQLPHKAA